MKRRLLLFLAAAAVAAAVDYAAEGARWWAHIQFLADDKLAGRDTGSDGFRKAAAYVAGEFERSGLKPAGVSGYFQQVRFETREVVTAQSSLALTHDGESQPLTLGIDAMLSGRAHLAPAIEAPLVFVGYGMVIPEARHNDLAGVDLHGKIAVYVNAAGPAEASGNIKSHYSSGAERWAALRRAGAIGIATLQNPRNANAQPRAESSDSPGGRGAPAPPQISFVLADPNLRENEGQSIAISITRRGAEKFFARSGHTAEEIQKLARENQPLPAFPLNVSLLARTTVRRDSVEAPNVIGMLPGSDLKLKDEFVIMSAHLDHVGVGRPVNGDNIYNGAMDDASGVASVLEIPRLLKESGLKPKRSILFLAVTAEEKGELGSRYFAAHPTVPARQIIADINLDMFLPLHSLKVIEVQGLAESTLGETIRAAANAAGVAVQADKEPEQNRFIRSDQYSFIRQGIPALAFKFGYEFGAPEEKLHQDWLRDRYHKPSDDLSQPVDQQAAAQFDRILMDLLLRVADGPGRPQWYSDSFFKRFARN